MKKLCDSTLQLRIELRVWQVSYLNHWRLLMIDVGKLRKIGARMHAAQVRAYEGSEGTLTQAERGSQVLARAFLSGGDGSPGLPAEAPEHPAGNL